MVNLCIITNMKKYNLVPLLLSVSFVSAEPAVLKSGNETIGCVQQEVISGESLKCRTTDGKEFVLKLAYMKAPDVNQRYDKEAKQTLSKLLSGEDSRFSRYGVGQKIEVVERNDTTKQILVVLKIPMGRARMIGGGDKTMWGVINEVMVGDGYAWHVPIKGKDKENASYAFFEKSAKNAKEGIWARSDSL